MRDIICGQKPPTVDARTPFEPVVGTIERCIDNNLRRKRPQSLHSLGANVSGWICAQKRQLAALWLQGIDAIEVVFHADCKLGRCS